MNNSSKINEYVSDQLARAEMRARAYVIDQQGRERPQRNAFVRLQKHLFDFRKGVSSGTRWIAISGLRGAGKTTLLAQLYCKLDVPKERKLFISADHAVQLLDSSITDIVSAYERIIAKPLETIIEPVFLFIDEVQYDPKWAIALKSVYDRAPNVFIISTGSSALEINSNPDTARRVATETLLPMSFTEYQKLTKNIFEEKGLATSLRGALINAKTARDIYDIFTANQSAINRYWTRAERLEINTYLEYGTLPFMAAANNPALAFDQLERSIDRILGSDIAKIGQFGADILARIPQVLYSVADSDAVSLNSLSGALDIPRPTLTRIFKALEQAEILFRLEPNGSHTSQVRKPDKYLFTTPAIRAMYFSLTGSSRTKSQVLGHLLEDVIGLYLRRVFGERSLTNSICYSTKSGSADFIVRHQQTTYVIEVGHGKKTTRQIETTDSVASDRIGILIGSTELTINEEKNIVCIPIRDFLLL